MSAIFFFAAGVIGATAVMIVLRAWWSWKAFREWRNRQDSDEKSRAV